MKTKVKQKDDFQQRVESIKLLVEYLYSNYKEKLFNPIDLYEEKIMKSIIRHEGLEGHDLENLHDIEIGWIKIEVNSLYKRNRKK